MLTRSHEAEEDRLDIAEPLRPEYAAILRNVNATDEQKADLVRRLSYVIREMIRSYLERFGRTPADEQDQ